MPKMKIAEVKGRPMLQWVGKRSIDIVENYPAQLVETYNGNAEPVNPEYKNLIKNWSNLLFHGDNIEVLTNLLQNGFRGKIDLIYIDPPFDSKADYIRKVELRNEEASEKLKGEGHNKLEQKQYFDIWKNDDYLQFMYERLILLKELLSDKGSIYLHCDWHKSHHLRCLLDEVFGEENFVNEIVWSYRSGGASKNGTLARKHDNILFYAKNKELFKIKTIIERQYLQKPFMGSKEDERGRFYVDTILTDTINGLVNRVIVNEIKEYNTRPVLNLSSERTDYPTQKPEGLIELLIEIASKEGSIVFDCFVGSGTTQVVAQKLGRRWIGCDINKGAIQTTSKRLQKVIQQQIADDNLFENSCSTAKFSHFKVNDYDLQILHTEAMELAVEKLGIEKLNDIFFDGKLSENLVKIIEFNRPFSLFDITDIEEEFKKRPEEDRNITIVCLGQREDTKDKIAEWNKKMPVNQFKIIDLTEKKFMLHEPCLAEVNLTNDTLTITNFISPTIIKRLAHDKGFKPEIKDFRAMIDCVLIDTDYNGKVFNVVYSDVPKKKNDLVRCSYKLKNRGKVAIKIIDMLGEEILIKDSQMITN